MGTARMGRDPKTSVLNAFNQVHDCKNVFVTDGAAMTSSSCVNPSITYMALTARAADFAVKALKKREFSNSTCGDNDSDSDSDYEDKESVDSCDCPGGRSSDIGLLPTDNRKYESVDEFADELTCYCISAVAELLQTENPYNLSRISSNHKTAPATIRYCVQLFVKLGKNHYNFLRSILPLVAVSTLRPYISVYHTQSNNTHTATIVANAEIRD
eukprot:gene30674-37925_t